MMKLHGWMVLLFGFLLGAAVGYLALSFIYLDWWFFLSDKASQSDRADCLFFMFLTGLVSSSAFIPWSADVDRKNRDRKRRELWR
jgi:hypothetical protein